MNEAGARVRQKNFDGAQRVLEADERWTPTKRSLAVEAHRLLQAEAGRKPLGINQALDVLTFQADDLVKHERQLGDEPGHLQGALQARELITRAREGSDSASLTPVLAYVDGVLATKSRNLATEGGDIEDVNQTRDVRNALVAEMERLQIREARTERAGRTLNQQQTETGQQLRTLWRQAAMPANGEALRRVDQMPAGELRYLRGELDRIRDEARQGKLDRGQLSHQLETALNQPYDTESVHQRNAAAAQERAERARKVIEAHATNQEEAPSIETEESARDAYRQRAHLWNQLEHSYGGEVSQAEFDRSFDAHAMERLRELATRSIDSLMRDARLQRQATGERIGHLDQVSVILGRSEVLRHLVSRVEGRPIERQQYESMAWSDFAPKYLGMELPADFDEYFVKR